MGARRVILAGLTTFWAIGASVALATPAITLPGELAYPESLAASSDGTLFIGSAKLGGVLRVTPGSSTPKPWIAPTTFGTRSIFGVLVDERSGMLWTCSNDLASDGIASPGSGAGSALKGFDLKTGAGKVVKLGTSRPITHPDGMRTVTGNTFLMVEAAGTLDRVSIRGDKALIETIRSDMVEPSAVTSVGRTAWVAEGQIGVLYDVKHPKPPKLPFDVVPVPVPLGVKP